MSQFPIDEQLVKRADYAYNPRPADCDCRNREKRVCNVCQGVEHGAYIDLVEQMMSTYTLTRQSHGNIYEQHRVGMAAALRVAADALLGPVTDEEWFNKGANRGALDAMLAARRARLLAPAQSAEERVRIEQRSSGDGSWEVWEDENYCGNHSERNAKALRLGLIATLKQEGK